MPAPYPIPDGFSKVTWRDVERGDYVYLLGLKKGRSYAYGPYTVSSVERRLLIDEKGRTFPNPSGGLLKRGR